MMNVLLVAWQIGQPLNAATYYWDADGSTASNNIDGTGLGGTGTWNTSTANWWDQTNDVAWPNAADTAVFTNAYTPGVISPATVTLSGALTANQLSFFRSGYTLGGTSLTLAGTDAGLQANLGESATIASQISGSVGLIKTGGGSIRLSNAANNYTGTTTIANGTLIIASQSALGAATDAVVVSDGNSTPSNTNTIGFFGGSLLLDGSTAGFTFSRDLNLSGQGPIGGRGAALLSIGDNTLSGIVTSSVSTLSPATFRNTRVSSVNGTLTLAGTIATQGTSASTFLSFGGVNTAGVGNYNLTGILSGTGSIEKSGAGTLFLNPSSVSGFSGTVRISSSATGQQSSVRVTQATVGGTSIFGANTVSGDDPSAIDLNGGVLEFRSDSTLDFNALSSGKNVYLRASSTVFTGPGVGGDAVNGLVTLGTFRVAANTTATFNNRNGFGLTFGGAWTQESSTANNTITNNMGGTLTFTGNAWNNSDTTARTLTIGGNGNTRITGSINAAAATLHVLTKTGSGSLTIEGTGTTLAGSVNANGGAIVITDFRSLNNNTATINIGTSSTAGALIIGTSVAPTSAGLTTSKVINLAGTTGGASIYANQAGVNPVILNANFTATGTGAKTLTLGGTNTADNIINGAIVNNSGTNTTALIKIGSGTWVLAGANGYTGSTTIANGTLKLKATGVASNVIADTSSIALGASNNYAGATLEFVGRDGENNVETLGTTGASGVALTYSGGGANTIRLTPGFGGTASLVINRLNTGGGGTLNFVGADFTNNKVSINQLNSTLGVPGNGVVTRSVFWNGADYAYIDGGVLRAPVYGVDAGTATTASGPLTSGSNNEITGSIATNTVSIPTLKINGSQTLTINSGQTLTLTGGVLATGGNAVITGGTAIATGTNAFVIRVNGAGDTLTLSAGDLTGSGGLTKSGAGTLILASPNSRTGTTEIAEGTVRLMSTGALSAANVTTNIRQNAVLELNGNSTGNAIGQFNNMGLVTNNGNTDATLTIGNAITTNGTAGTSYGIITDGTGSGITNLTISTANNTAGQTTTFVLNGLSSYTGVTTLTKATIGNLVVSANTLADIGQDSSIGRGNATNDASNAASLVFSGLGGELRYIGNILEGNLTLGSTSASTNRLFTLEGTMATLSSTASNNNAIVWSNTGAIVHGTNADRTLIFDGTSTGDNTFNPQITDSTGFVTSVTKNGAGQWNLGNSNNTYTGLTTISNGIFALNDNGALPANSPLVLGSTTTSGILQMSGTLTRNLTTTPTAGTGTISWGGTTGGGGFAAHTTALTVTLNGGAGLTWGSGGFVGTGGTQALIFNSASALADVTFTNAIDLGASTRTLTVNDNSNTGADYATLSGVLSGAGGGILKNGNGILRLNAANSYTGTTEVQAGTLVVSSLGSSSGSGTSSVGASGVTMGDGNAIILGNATTSGGILEYVGTGEVSDRKIRLNGTTASNQIHADGSGALILTNVAHDTATIGNKTLYLRGNSTAGNMITSKLSDNGLGVLSVTVDGSATWILTNSANNYTGTTTVSGGALGIGDNSAIGAILTISNGNVFAYGGDRTLTNTLNLGNNATSGFIGDYSLIFNGTNNLAAGANNINLYNSILGGEALVLNGLLANSLTATRTWALDGTGETIINGDFTTSTTFGVSIVKTGNGTLTLGTNGATSNWNQAGSALDLDRGTLKFTANNAIPTATATNTGLTISPDLATTDTATVDLNGTTQTVNALTATTDGTVVIDNTSSTAATFRFGANDTAVNFGSGTGNYTITDSGTGALSIVKMGNTTATIPGGVTLTYQGSTESEGGGIFNIASAVNGTTALKATGSSTLALTGGITAPGAITSIEVGGGSTLSLLDGAGSAISNLTTLNLGNTGSSTVTLNLNVGTGATDTLTLLTGNTANLGNTITINMTDAGLAASTTYTLINLVDGGFTAFGTGKVIQGATPGGFDSMVWTVTDKLVQLTTGTLITGKSWWNAGGALDNWNDVANWAITNKDGLTPATSIPGQGTDVVFIADNITGGAAITTTLEQNFKINSLTFEASTTPADTPASVTINPGALSTARLEIAPQLATDGIAITTGGSPVVNIATALKIGTNQTWDIADAASTLTLGGALFGAADVTKSGSGKITLTAAADPTFNSGLTTDFTITAGNLEITNAGALGSTANNNAANLIVNGGAFYYNNAVSGTVNNNLTLGGGTLSAGGASQTYNGTVNVSGDSFINMADSNGPNTNTARSITLSGVVSGSGSLTIDSSNVVSSGNQLSGTLTLNNVGNTWNGDLIFNEGTVVLTSAVSPGFTNNDVTFSSFGRFNLQGVNSQTLTRTGTLTYAAGAIGELGVDNTSSPLSTDFLVVQNGAITLGSGGTGGNVRVYLSDAFSKLNITGGVTLGGSSSISVGGDAAGRVIISSVISDGGSGYGLAINDDAGGWGTTNRTVRLTGLNTFTGNFTLGEGTVEFDTVTNISGGASSLGNGTAITTGSGTLSFIGGTSQSTDRPITMNGATILSANGTGGATITYNGAINAGGNSLTLTGTAEGFITGGVTQTGTSADLNVNSGTWHLSGATSTLADDLFVNAASTGTAVVNLDSTGVLAYTTGTSNGLVAQSGGVINLGADDVNGVANSGGMDFILLGYSTVGATGVLNTNGYNITTPSLTLGDTTVGIEGSATGSGTITVTTTITLNRGSIAANLAGAGNINKNGVGTVTLSGDNSGLTSTSGAATLVQNGILILDYTASNTAKISTVGGLEMRGGTLQLYGNASAATSQTVNGLNLDGTSTTDDSGASRIVLNPGAGQEIVLNLGAINRTSTNSDGTIRFVLPSGVQSATNGITTSTGTTNGLLGSAGYATVEDGTGTWFATKSGSNIVGLVSTVKNDVTTWVKNDHITDGTTGFTGSVSGIYLNSLRFDAAGGSDLNLTATGVLGVASGGLLITDNVGGTPSIAGGTLFSGASELIFTQDSAQTFAVSSDIRVNHAVTKSGAGTLLLSGNNTYTDETNIFEGTLQVSGGNAIGDYSTVDLATTRDTTLQLLSDETIGRLQGGSRLNGADYGTLDIGSHTLSINQSSSATFSGFITGSGRLVMNAGNTGNLLLNNVSSGFTGEVIVNGGLFYFNGIGQINASAFTINKSGNILIDNNGTTRSGNRIQDTATITLNSADGAYYGRVQPRGLAIRTDQDSTLNETVGVITANSGASYVTMEATTSSDDSRIFAADIQRNNNATLNVRGTNLGGSSSQENELSISVSANETAFIAALVGGAGSAGSKNISIVPWAIGESYAGAIADEGLPGVLASSNMGNSLVTYAAGSGFRPLNFATEYNTIALAAAADNARESLSGDLTGLAGTTVNALVLDNNNTAAINVSGAGAGQALVNTSGTFLFTLSNGVASSAYTTTLGGFDSGISVGGTNEYVFFVNNPSASAVTPTLTASITSQLTTAADITKSGRGTLVLNQVNTAGGGANKTTLNEGILEIADLDNIGGSTGALVFAGGTLRLGTGLTDDISTRTISFLLGGGTLDTNGIDLTLANSLGSGLGGFTKAGAGNLTLNGTATYTGNSVLSLGTITIGANNALGNGGNLTLAGGTTLAFSGAQTLTHGLVTTTGASPAITGAGTISASTGFFFNHTGDTTIGAVLAGAGGVLKAQPNVVTLTGASTYAGTTEVQNGTLSFNSIGNVGGGASALGAPTTAEAGIIRMGYTGTATTLNYTGSGHSSDRIIGMQGTTGSVTLDADGTGALALTGGVRFEMAGNKTLILRGSSAPAIDNSIGGLTEIGGVLTLNKADSNTWVVNGGNTYTGVTQVDNGTLKIGATDALPIGTTVRLGSGTTAGTLDLNGFNQTIGSLLSQTNSASVTNQILVGAGNTLTINGAVSIGVDVEDSTTKLNALGGGAIVVNSGGGNFGVGAATGGENGTVDVDFSGLSTFTANLGTGTFRLGDPNTDTDANPTTMKLAVNNSITASAIRIGDGTGGVATHTLTLGSGTNTLNADTINVGSASNTIRSSGIVMFDGGDTTGTLTVRASDGSSRTVLNMVNSTGSTSVDMAATINLAGHTADLLVSTLTMANRTTNTGAGNATLTFDQGTLDVTTWNMASRTSTGTGNATATVNLGDSAAPGSPMTTIGALNMAVNTSGGGTVSADFNVTGGTVAIGDGLNTGTAINMANAAASRTATSTIDLTGGSVSVTGDIVRTGGAGTENATVTLNGSTLAMNGNSVGDATNTITFDAQSGTLTGLAELNGGGLLTKSTAGTLTMGNGNTYTGGTSVTAGTLEVVNTTGSGTGTGAVTVGTGAVLSGSGSIAGATTIAAGGVLAPGVGNTATSNQTMTFTNTGTSLSVADTGAIQLGLTTADTTDSAFASWFHANPGGTAAQYVVSVGGIGNTTWNSGHAGDHDFITAAGTVVLGSSPTMDKRVVVSLNNATGLTYGSIFNLLDWTTVSTLDGTPLSTMASGNFNTLDNVQLDALSGGLGWDTSLFDNYGILVVVPEPSRAVLLLLGILGLMLRRRRR